MNNTQDEFNEYSGKYEILQNEIGDILVIIAYRKGEIESPRVIYDGGTALLLYRNKESSVFLTDISEDARQPIKFVDKITVVEVKDERLDKIVEIVKPRSIVPTSFSFTDIAGLVKGASKGEGLGNKFLSHIREVDAIIQVVRCFDDENTIHVAGKVDPISDIEIINAELALADLASVERRLQRMVSWNQCII